MYLVLFGVGLLVTAAGFLTIGFGIPINAFSLGNTLIVAGTVAVVGGLVLIALAVAVRQLSRIAQALQGRALEKVPAPRAAPAEPSESLVPPTARLPHAPARMPVPPKPVEAAMPRPPEPRFPAASNEEPPGPLDWLRARPKASKPASEAPASEPPVMDVADEVPLSPRAPARPPFSLPPLNSSSTSEPKAWSPGRGNSDTKESKPDIQPRAEQIMRTTPAAERGSDMSKDAVKAPAKESGLFDVVWPDARSKQISEPAQREPKPEPALRPREEARGEERTKTASERPAAILKSGVIDGMAYTLYADGSIEAELPQGTVRFASVDALRAHLEKSV